MASRSDEEEASEFDLTFPSDLEPVAEDEIGLGRTETFRKAVLPWVSELTRKHHITWTRVYLSEREACVQTSMPFGTWSGHTWRDPKHPPLYRGPRVTVTLVDGTLDEVMSTLQICSDDRIDMQIELIAPPAHVHVSVYRTSLTAPGDTSLGGADGPTEP